MKLVTTIAQFRDYANSFADEVALFEGTGFRYLDISFFWSAEPGSRFITDDWKGEIEDAGETAKQIGCQFVQAHSPMGNPLASDGSCEGFMKYTKRSIEACHMLGIENTVIHAGRMKNIGKEEFFERNRAFIKDLIPTAEEFGVNLLVENVFGSHYSLRTGKDLREFIDYVDHPLVHAIWDTGHANVIQISQYENILAIGDELRGLHIHGNNTYLDDHLPPFVGKVNMDEVIPALIEIKYPGYFNFESNYLIRLDNAFPERTGLSSDDRLFRHARDICKQGVALQYEIGKCILTAFDQYEC